MALASMLLLFVFAMAWMTRPLWRARVDAGQRRRAANVAAYHQRLGEIEADRGAGLLDEATAASLRAELDARLLADAEGVERTTAAPARSGLLGAFLVLVVAGVALFGYLRQDSWRLQTRIAAAPRGGAAEGPTSQARVEEMVGRLAQRLEQNPADVDGWALLARAYFAMERYADAAVAYGKANALTNGQEPDLLTGEGEALAMAGDRNLPGRPQRLFEQALALAPDHGKALWYAGLSAAQSGDAALARERWEKLSRQELPEAMRAVLDRQLAELGGAAPASEPAPAAAAGVALRVSVSLAPPLADRVTADATLFVFARAADGPPMPLAVHRGKAADLPQEVRLDDSMAMTPAARLSQFDRWVVTARLSRSGQAQAASGDLQGSLTVERGQLGDAALALVIDQVVP